MRTLGLHLYGARRGFGKPGLGLFRLRLALVPIVELFV